jgi:hypothetical protein
MRTAHLEFIADNVVPKSIEVEVVLGDILDSSFLFGHNSLIFFCLYAKNVPNLQVAVASVHMQAKVACVAICVRVWGTRACNL